MFCRKTSVHFELTKHVNERQAAISLPRSVWEKDTLGFEKVHYYSKDYSKDLLNVFMTKEPLESR